MRRLALVIVGLVLGAAVSLMPASGVLVMVDLGTLGGPYGVAESLNDLGWVAGTSEVEPEVQRATLWKDGSIVNLGTLGGDWSQAYGINNLGQVVGVSGAYGGWKAFLWEDEVLVNLGALGGEDMASDATDINNLGHVVGSSQSIAGPPHAFLWTPEAGMVDIGTLGGPVSSGQAINDLGQIVGTATNADGDYRAFLWEDGTMIDLGATAPDDWCYSQDINNVAQIVGYCMHRPSGTYEGFLWEHGTLTSLGSGVGSLWVPTAINDVGQIVGVTTTEEGEDHAALLDDGLLTDLGTFGGDYSDARDINGIGEVVGLAVTHGTYESRPALWRLITGSDVSGILQDHVGSLVASGEIDASVGRALGATLAAVSMQVDGDHLLAATRLLQAFIAQVDAFARAGRIPAALGSDLIQEAEDAIVLLGMPR